mmetsp:Transcript_17418/g.47566  ORF Transcript_17418/g.47566 Transcript_17418/m.47566 type:complete len:282 (+) Transcript_17418:627-1472(+)
MRELGSWLMHVVLETGIPNELMKPRSADGLPTCVHGIGVKESVALFFLVVGAEVGVGACDGAVAGWGIGAVRDAGSVAVAAVVVVPDVGAGAGAGACAGTELGATVETGAVFCAAPDAGVGAGAAVSFGAAAEDEAWVGDAVGVNDFCGAPGLGFADVATLTGEHTLGGGTGVLPRAFRGEKEPQPPKHTGPLPKRMPLFQCPRSFVGETLPIDLCGQSVELARSMFDAEGSKSWLFAGDREPASLAALLGDVAVTPPPPGNGSGMRECCRGGESDPRNFG